MRQEASLWQQRQHKPFACIVCLGHTRGVLLLQVTLFKRNYHHVVSDSYFKAYHTVARGNPNYFITYGNGKSAARIQAGLRPNGAHRWYNYNKAPK